jgi:hypothetical protein
MKNCRPATVRLAPPCGIIAINIACRPALDSSSFPSAFLLPTRFLLPSLHISHRIDHSWQAWLLLGGAAATSTQTFPSVFLHCAGSLARSSTWTVQSTAGLDFASLPTSRPPGGDPDQASLSSLWLCWFVASSAAASTSSTGGEAPLSADLEGSK